jgi:hypothetical protein
MPASHECCSRFWARIAQRARMGLRAVSGNPTVSHTPHTHAASTDSGVRLRAAWSHLDRCILVALNLSGTMFKRLCAISLLILAASPFTAPFQTFDNSGPLHGYVDGEITLTMPAVSSVVFTDDAGSLIAPPGSRLRIDLLSLVGASTPVVAQLVAFRTRWVAPIARISPHASPSIALRV